MSEPEERPREVSVTVPRGTNQRGINGKFLPGNTMGFQPGQSGNPGGRPKSIRTQLTERLGKGKQAEVIEEIAKAVEQIARDGLNPYKPLPPILEFWLEREYPKLSRHELTGADGDPIAIEPRQAPEIPEDAERDKEVALILSGLDPDEDRDKLLQEMGKGKRNG